MKDINTANKIIRDSTMMNKKRETIKMNPAQFFQDEANIRQ